MSSESWFKSELVSVVAADTDDEASSNSIFCGTDYRDFCGVSNDILNSRSIGRRKRFLYIFANYFSYTMFPGFFVFHLGLMKNPDFLSYQFTT